MWATCSPEQGGLWLAFWSSDFLSPHFIANLCGRSSISQSSGWQVRWNKHGISTVTARHKLNAKQFILLANVYLLIFFLTSKISFFRNNRVIAIQNISSYFNPQSVLRDTVLKYIFRREVEILEVLHLSTFLPLCLCLLGFPGQEQPPPLLLSRLTSSDSWPRLHRAAQAPSPSAPRPHPTPGPGQSAGPIEDVASAVSLVLIYSDLLFSVWVITALVKQLWNSQWGARTELPSNSLRKL